MQTPDDRRVIAEFVDVHRHYTMGDSVVRALDGVSVQVRRGDYVAIMGRSGSGKSTMLNLLGCLDRPTAGQIPDRRPRRDPTRRRRALRSARHRDRLHLPVVQPDPPAHGPREPRSAAVLPGARRPRVAREGREPRRAGRPRGTPRAPPDGAFRRSATTRRDRPRPDERPAVPARRRSDRQPRQQHRDGDPRAVRRAAT